MEKPWKNRIILLSGCLIFIHPLLILGRDDIVPGSRYTSGRAAALGDAFLPLGDDTAAALFYNPAAVGRIRHPQTEGVNLSFYGNTNFLGSIGLSNLSAYKVTGLESYASTLQKFPGDAHSIGGAILPGFATPGFAFGALLQSQLSSHGNADGTISYKSRYQFIPALTLGTRLAQGIVRVGYNIQWVNQAIGTIENVSATTSNLGYNQNLAQGSGVSHNFGFALTFPIRYLPSVNIVARNVLGTHYIGKSVYAFSPTETGAPPDEPMTVDASLSIQPKLGAGLFMNLVLEQRDLTSQSAVSVMGRMAIGAELSFRDLFFLRSGWGSGYPSLGLGIRRESGASLSLTWYSEEVGSGYQSVRDTRYLMQYQLRSF